MKKRTNKHSKCVGSSRQRKHVGRGRPPLSGNVHIEPVHTANLDLTKLAHTLEQYWNCLGSADRAKLIAK